MEQARKERVRERSVLTGLECFLVFLSFPNMDLPATLQQKGSKVFWHSVLQLHKRSLMQLSYVVLCSFIQKMVVINVLI